jgi:hypothetical protein
MAVKDGRFPLHIPLALTTDDAEVHVTVSLVYCREGDEGVCVIKSFRWIVSVQATPDGDGELLIDHVLVPELLAPTQTL